MKTNLLDVLACPKCSGSLVQQDGPDGKAFLSCTTCGAEFPMQNGIPIFTNPPEQLVPSEKIARGPDTGTPWRRANWRFLADQMVKLDPNAIILDVGAGRGDFAEALKGHRTLALDVYPYPEVDLVCDLTQVVPVKARSLDAVVLMNVMEHVYDTHALLATICAILKPGGLLLVAIPFMVKIHQAPVDYVRYTQFALQELGEAHGFKVDVLEGYYDPIFFLEEGLGNLRWSAIPALPKMKRFLARSLLAGIQALSNLIGALLPPGAAKPVQNAKSMAPTGYQIVYRKL